MAVSRLERRKQRVAARQPVRPQLATLIMLGIVLLTGCICAAWFAGEGRIYRIFAQLNQLQQSRPLWLEVPMVAGQYLLAPTVLLLVVALGIMKASPQPRKWSRSIVVSILLVLTGRYIVWRSLATLNLADPLNGVFSLGLFFLEMLMLLSGTLQLGLMLRVRDRRLEADLRSVAVVEAAFTPSVDILIPTYNEPVFILRRTVIGCQALDYANKRIYLLDDTRRPEVQALAADL